MCEVEIAVAHAAGRLTYRIVTRQTTTLEEVLGLELVELGEDRATGRFAVSDAVRQHLGIVHGGVYASLAESLASHATHTVVSTEGNAAMGLSNVTNFLRPVTDGEVHGDATCCHRGRTTWVWDVRLTDSAGRLCAISRVTVAVRPAPTS
jgi:1,4-dihydroxy-2-naphthoyl-CoA hydrolase